MHASEKVTVASRAMCIWPIIIPTPFARLLHPLHADNFYPLDHVLDKLYEAARACSANRELGLVEFMRCADEAVRSVLCGRGRRRAC